MSSIQNENVANKWKKLFVGWNEICLLNAINLAGANKKEQFDGSIQLMN